MKATSKNVIPAKAGIQNPLTSLDSSLRGSDKLIIIRGSLYKYTDVLYMMINRSCMVCHSGLDPESSVFLDSCFRRNDVLFRD